MEVIAIVQARMGSTRLPGKVLVDVCGQPLLKRLIDRVRATPGIDEVVVATTTDQSDDCLSMWCAEHALPVYRGCVDDVLDRFWQCLQKYKAKIIVRVTADDPLKDPTIIQNALELCKFSPKVDYVSNTLEPSYPEGLDIEVFRYHALERAANEATLPSEREHVTPYIWKHPDRFVLCGFGMQPNLSHWRWTVDKPADLELIRRIFTQFPDQPLVDYETVIAWLNNHPELLLMSSGTMRNEGYYKSINQEQNQ